MVPMNTLQWKYKHERCTSFQVPPLHMPLRHPETDYGYRRHVELSRNSTCSGFSPGLEKKVEHFPVGENRGILPRILEKYENDLINKLKKSECLSVICPK